MAWYLWKAPYVEGMDSPEQNEDGWVYIETNHYAFPPSGRRPWQRVYSFGVGSVSGAGSSPSRGSVRYR